MDELLNKLSPTHVWAILFFLAMLVVFSVRSVITVCQKNATPEPTQEDVTKAILNLFILERNGLTLFCLNIKLHRLMGRRVREGIVQLCLSRLVADDLVSVGFDDRYCITAQGRSKLRKDTVEESRRLSLHGSPPHMLN